MYISSRNVHAISVTKNTLFTTLKEIPSKYDIMVIIVIGVIDNRPTNNIITDTINHYREENVKEALINGKNCVYVTDAYGGNHLFGHHFNPNLILVIKKEH